MKKYSIEEAHVHVSLREGAMPDDVKGEIAMLLYDLYCEWLSSPAGKKEVSRLKINLSHRIAHQRKKDMLTD